MVGAGTALVVSAVLLPVDPMALARAGMDPLVVRLAAVLDEIAEALGARDADAAGRALVAASEAQAEYEALRQYLDAAGDTVRITPGRLSVRELSDSSTTPRPTCPSASPPCTPPPWRTAC